MVEMRAGALNTSSNDLVANYVNYLQSQLKGPPYSSLTSSWISKIAYNQTTALGNNAASLEYSMDADIFDCSYVWPKYDAAPNADLSLDFFTGAVPIIDIQLAKGKKKRKSYPFQRNSNSLK